ncbi:Uncharacterised protein [Porphyromonas cangingivalis]|nr:Uncharacterised protein [Porphyromonas cangingivalis]
MFGFSKNQNLYISLPYSNLRAAFGLKVFMQIHSKRAIFEEIITADYQLITKEVFSKFLKINLYLYIFSLKTIKTFFLRLRGF